MVFTARKALVGLQPCSHMHLRVFENGVIYRVQPIVFSKTHHTKMLPLIGEEFTIMLSTLYNLIQKQAMY